MDRKKALIVAYYWPPAGGPGVQRWLKFVKYLPEFNIDPVVYIPENANYPMRDDSLIDEIPESVTIIKKPIKEPYRFASILSKKSASTISKGIIAEKKKQSLLERLMLYIRGNFFIPDARKSWVKPSVAFLKDYLVNENIDVIITTGPPHSLHLIGLSLKRMLDVRWIADFRDPWTTIGYHKQLKLTKKSAQKHEDLEHQVLNAADQILVTSNVTKKQFESLTHKPIEVITNGYDKESVGNVALDKKFSLSHIGSLLSKRNPEVLWKVLKDLIIENKSFSRDFQLKLVGDVSDDVISAIKNYDLENHLNLVGYVSHNESVVFQKSSQVLLMIEIDSEDTKCIIPGKLFEYMVSGRPIISIGPKESDVERILKETNTGNYFGYTNYEDLKSIILEHYGSFKKNNLESFPIGLQKYSRRKLTEQLVNILNK